MVQLKPAPLKQRFFLTYSYMGIYINYVPRAATTSDAFNAIAEPRRREILNYLALQERPVGDIVATLGLEQPSVSKHLRVLLEVGLVQVRRDGRHMLYRTDANAIRPLHEWTNTFDRLWRNQLTRVKERAERPSAATQGEQMTQTSNSIEELTLNVTQEILVRASPDATFAALLEEIGPQNQGPDGSLMPMKLEAWPGGRWYRDLGSDNGHFWGHVQAIKRPTLLEISGPLFMSYTVVSNVQYRFSEVDGGTLIKFQHAAFGLIQEVHRDRVKEGWGRIHERVRLRAEGTGSRPS
jgi:DNA-binding transcriptional ArsR family regulator